MSRSGEAAIDLVICDTAGRLHTAYALMEELEACKKAIGTAIGGQPDETLLVLDGTTGLNMLNQVCARERGEEEGGGGREGEGGELRLRHGGVLCLWASALSSPPLILLALPTFRARMPFNLVFNFFSPLSSPRPLA